MGAILTQRTSWQNAEKALLSLDNGGWLSLEGIAQLESYQLLIPAVRAAGFFNTKPKKLWEFCRFVVNNYGGIEGLLEEKLGEVREKLLSLYGIGPETADTILLYGLDKPSFVIDEYTKRLVKKEKLSDSFDYNFLKNFFEKNLPAEVKIYQDFHALIIFSQKEKGGWGMKKI